MDEKRKQELNNKISQVKSETGFQMPKEMTSRKEMLGENHYCYTFVHEKLGDIGKIIVKPLPNKDSKFEAIVLGGKDDPMTKRRSEIFEPFADQLGYNCTFPPNPLIRILAT